MKLLSSKRITKNTLRLWLVLTVFAIGSLADVAAYAEQQPHTALALTGLACLAVLKSTTLTLGYVLCSINRWLKAIMIAILVVFASLSLLNAGCWLFYGFGISMKLLKIIAETNLEEIRDFLPELTEKLFVILRSPWLWLSIIVFSTAWEWLPNIPKTQLVSGVATLSCMGCLYLVYVLTSAEFGRTNHLILARSGRYIAKYIRDRQTISKLNAMRRALPFPESLSSSYAAERIVVVIGESASRGHTSLYGYPLPTTPRVDSLRDELLIFNDAVASSAFTAENMPRLLSLMTDKPSDKEWYEFPSIFQIFHGVGYKTYWLSNQEYSGQWSNLSSIISADADVVRYVGGMDSEDHYLYRYDDALLPEWQEALAAKDTLQLTFLHLMGSHFQYIRRFPPSRTRFTPQDILKQTPREWLDEKKAGIVANYDNSILYTDSVVACVIDGVRRLKAPAILIYLSDHGENVYDDRDYRGRDTKHVEVPFFIYTNDAYRRKNPLLVQNIERACSASFSTSELPQMLMHLSGTTYCMYDSVFNPISPAFKTRQRWVDGEVFYKDVDKNRP